MALEHYEIRLPEGLTLLVKVTSHPVNLDIVFPDGNKVNFDYAPGPPLSHSINPAVGLSPVPIPESGLPKPATRTTVSQLSAIGPAISYVKYNDGTYPMVP